MDKPFMYKPPVGEPFLAKFVTSCDEGNYTISHIVPLEDNTPIEELLKAFNLSRGWGNAVETMQTLNSKEEEHEKRTHFFHRLRRMWNKNERKCA